MIQFFKKFIFSFNSIAIILLFGSYASTLANPEIFWPLVFLGLAFPFLVIINIIFFIFWLLQFNRRALYSLIALLIGSKFILQTIQIKPKTPLPAKGNQTVKIISYNTGLFGYYQSKWYTMETIEKINKRQPDIVCMQEFLNMGIEGQTTLDSIKNGCGFNYHYFEKLNDGRKKGEYGLVIFSKYKIREKGMVDFDQITGNMCIYADVTIDTGTYRIYNMHLQSFRFKKKDYKFIENLPEDNQEKIAHSKNMLSRMKHAYVKRSIQAHEIKRHLRQFDGDYFLIGDFNDPPVSYSYHILSKNMKDAFIENGNGMGKTYIGVMPNFRIDYILYPSSFRGLSYRTYQLQSDHKMVETVIEKDLASAD